MVDHKLRRPEKQFGVKYINKFDSKYFGKFNLNYDYRHIKKVEGLERWFNLALKFIVLIL